MAVNPRAMKNPERLAASKKQPRYPVYEPGGRIVWIKPGMEELVFGKKETSDGAKSGSEPIAELKITLQE